MKSRWDEDRSEVEKYWNDCSLKQTKSVNILESTEQVAMPDNTNEDQNHKRSIHHLEEDDDNLD
ncbi:hypothetical protein BGZ76_011058 [Entomortierella beljakovae]|nr:hypothetical protein BGZ76_011058 [Entomortierella beljakovae]